MKVSRKYHIRKTGKGRGKVRKNPVHRIRWKSLGDRAYDGYGKKYDFSIHYDYDAGWGLAWFKADIEDSKEAFVDIIGVNSLAEAKKVASRIENGARISHRGGW